MSITKRLIEKTEEAEALRAALESILDEGLVEHPASVGIARKIINDGDIDSLSQKQLEVFEKHISPHMNLLCEACKEPIPHIQYPKVLANSHIEGMVLCDGCRHFREQMRKD